MDDLLFVDVTGDCEDDEAVDLPRIPEMAKPPPPPPTAAGLQADELLLLLLLLLLEEDSQLDAGCWVLVDGSFEEVIKPVLLPAGGFIMAVTDAGIDNPVVWFM